MDLIIGIGISLMTFLGFEYQTGVQKYHQEILAQEKNHRKMHGFKSGRFLVKFDVQNLSPDKLAYLALRNKSYLEFPSWVDEKTHLNRAIEKAEKICSARNKYCEELYILKGHLNRRGKEIEQAIYHWSDIAWRHVDVKAPDAYQEFYEYLVEKKQNSECRKYTLEESTEKVAACLKKDHDRFLKSQAGNKLVELFYQSYTNKYATIPRDLPPFGWMIPAPMSEEQRKKWK